MSGNDQGDGRGSSDTDNDDDDDNLPTSIVNLTAHPRKLAGEMKMNISTLDSRSGALT